jgi:beta-phosphoglucomutase
MCHAALGRVAFCLTKNKTVLLYNQFFERRRLQMKIRGVAFDLEGTIVNLEAAHHGAHLKVMKMVGLLDLPLEEAVLEEAVKVCPHFIGGPHEVLMREIYEAGNKSLSPHKISELDIEYFKEIRASIPIVPRDGFLQVLQELREMGIKTSVGSVTERADALFILERAGLLELFPREMIVLKEDVRELKPAPDVFLETARRMGIQPTEQVVFEDSPNGVLAARRAGSIAIGMPVYNQPYVIIRLLESGAARVFMDWREMALRPLLSNLEASA